jgi:serine palmitoyltransferase
MEPAATLSDENTEFVKSTLDSVYELIVSIPGSNHILSYLKNVYQHDPFRIALELFLVFFAIKYMMSKKYKPHDNAVKLTNKVRVLLH